MCHHSGELPSDGPIDILHNGEVRREKNVEVTLLYLAQ